MLLRNARSVSNPHPDETESRIVKTLFGTETLEAKISRAFGLMDKAVAQYKPIGVYAMFSGGHDSLVATHLASKHPLFTAVWNINTGIGIDKTRQFVHDTCLERGWPLKRGYAELCGQFYADIVKKHGFPGPIQHRLMYIQLKERPLRRLIREAKKRRNDRVMLVTGVRSEESTTRMGYDAPITKEAAKVWVSPIIDWTASECNEYIEANGLKRNEVVDLMHMSGECLCGAYARPGEFKEIKCWFPETAHQIQEIEAEVRGRGFNWGWGEIPPHSKHKKDDPEQMKIPGMLCYGCPTKRGAV